MNKIKLGITGYTGKMGQAILAELNNFPMFALSVVLTNKKTDSIEENITFTNDIDELCSLSDLVIDFSAPEIFGNIINSAIKYKTALVSGTTSLQEKDFQILKKASQIIPILYSQNMSIGVSVVCSLIREVYLKLSDKSDVEIIEMHHRNKKDTPSGTAILLASEMLNKKDIKSECIQRNLFETSTHRPSQKIGISSVRGGTIAGQHEVIFMMENETIKISHQALNRNIFALGALKAGHWLHKQQAGLYSMKDFLNHIKV